jgi:predicted branched-subunit amino acid permease
MTTSTFFVSMMNNGVVSLAIMFTSLNPNVRSYIYSSKMESFMQLKSFQPIPIRKSKGS